MLSSCIRVRSIGRRWFSSTPEQAIEEMWPKLDQKVFTGTEAVSQLKQSSGLSKPLIVTDKGISSVGVLEIFRKAYFPTSKVFADAVPNSASVYAAQQAYYESGSDGIIALGGGGPMDVAKVTAWILGASNAKIITSKPIAIEQELLDFKKTMSKVNADANLQDKYRKALPKLAMVPTTAGTGSDGGKSAVVYFPDRKHMIGDPSLIAPYVALNPLYTQSLPSKLTAATAVDALAHAMEAYLVTSKAAEKDGMTKEQTGIADEFALHALELILTNLPTAMAMPDDLNARLALQIAALFSAKAFRKGDLGAVHATAHSIGAEFHLHHGECIARMFIPVFKFNEEHLRSWSPEDSSIKETREKFEVLRKTFERHGHRSDTLTGAIELFLRSLETPYGLEGLGPDLDFDRLSEAASVDSCNTNPIPLTIKNYKEIFQAAAGNRI